MAYLIDRTRALRSRDIVAMVSVRLRRVRSRVILRDNSLYHTLTRVETLVRHSRAQLGTGRRRRGTTGGESSQGA